MIYFNNFLYYLLNTFNLYPLYGCLFAIFFTEIYIIYKIITNKQLTRDLKIYNFNLNTLFITIYFVVFIIILLIFRYIRFGYTFDLISFFNNINVFYSKVPFIFFVDFIFLLLLLFLLLIKFKNFLNREILKRHLYYYYFSHLESVKNFVIKNPGKYPTRKDYSLYVRICDNLKDIYNYSVYVDKIVLYGILTNYCKLLHTDYYPRQLKTYSTFILIHLYKIIFIILVIIDCIHLIFYYLPFYFLIHLWISCSSFLKKTFDSLNNIIYERYYLENFVKYINTSDEEDEFIFKYIERHCICFTHDIKGKDFDDVWEKKELIYAFPQIFIYNRRFMRVDNTNVFRNYSTDEEILEETLKETPIY